MLRLLLNYYRYKKALDRMFIPIKDLLKLFKRDTFQRFWLSLKKLQISKSYKWTIARVN